jgi:glycosyltransferase involved in cell wall biosynthesis
MNIEAFIICWNEAETLHLTIKHYQKFCSSIVIMDNHSNDNSREIATAMGCKVKTFGVKGELSDRAYLDVKNNIWKRQGRDSRDYVIVCDADEILSGFPPDNQYSIYKTIGWDVFSHDMPVDDWLEITNGHHQENYSKNIVFDPKRITDINYRIGCHVSKPVGDVSWAPEGIFLLHYRNVGGPQRLIDRHAVYRERLSQENKQRGFGIHYTWDDEVRVNEWNEKFRKSKPLFPVGGE